MINDEWQLERILVRMDQLAIGRLSVVHSAVTRRRHRRCRCAYSTPSMTLTQRRFSGVRRARRRFGVAYAPERVRLVPNRSFGLSRESPFVRRRRKASTVVR
jgi:hypothetical protein